ncbi:MAG: SPOR domain-containing protein [Bacteroidales bacterium]|mgnify:CR=1 FL=1|nr:SPOR domain-containing protein [Bacteroidales bacterium]MDD4669803.1 SPOR domain-containing protein [Bacteroidales bacterium]
MKRWLLVIILASLFNCAAHAQEPYGYSADSLKFINSSQVDTTLVGRSIFDVLSERDFGSGRVIISQSSSILRAMQKHAVDNNTKRINGYRVRIYFDNSRNARTQSEYIANAFAEEYPNVRVYRSHVSPYFKVTVGDFRNRSDAHRFATEIKGKYPSVFLIRESINYPTL